MYFTLLLLHSFVRWIALVTLVAATITSLTGYFNGSLFTSRHNTLRHWTATALHVQLAIGFLLYFSSPADDRFFTVIHPLMMLIAVLLATFGSSLAKREKTDGGKFKTMALFFSIALAIVLVSIPWPFSPLSARPVIRTF